MSWIDCKVRKPTVEDGDPIGLVYVRTETGGLDIVLWGAVMPYHVAWMRVPEFTPLPDPPDGHEILTDYNADWHPNTMHWVPRVAEWQYSDLHHRREYVRSEFYAVPIKPPEPQYRPFANAEEFKPYRNRWWRNKGSDRLMPPSSYSETNFASCDWQHAFETLEFECGHPFGVKIHG